MKKTVTLLALASTMIITALLPIQGESMSIKSPFGNPLTEMKNALENGDPFLVDIISNDDVFKEKLEKGKFYSKFNFLSMDKLNSSNAKTVWLGEDMISSVLDKENPNHNKVNFLLEQGKLVFFLSLNDTSKISDSFDLPKKAINKNNNDDYKTIASWLHFSNIGIPTIGDAILPLDDSDYLEDVLKTAWIFKDGLDKAVVDKSNKPFQNNSSSSLFNLKPKTVYAQDGYFPNISSAWSQTGSYNSIIYDIPYGIVNQTYRYDQLSNDSNIGMFINSELKLYQVL